MKDRKPEKNELVRRYQGGTKGEVRVKKRRRLRGNIPISL